MKLLSALAITLAAIAPAPVLIATPAATTQATTRPDASYRSPEETIRSIDLPPGYHLELIASEPDIVAPVNISWDGNGRMYVAEMRTYMRDIEDTGAKDPISRVSRFEDTAGNGVYDKHAVFADKLALPRMVLPLDERVLIRETDTSNINCYRDTKGVGVADEKTLFHKGGPQTNNLEHQASGLIWNIDNWIYDSMDGTRFRFTRGKLETQSVYHEFAQWGLGMDDVGKMYYSSAGYERPSYDFQQPIVYGKIELPGELAEGFTEVWPIVGMPDVEGGEKRLRPTNHTLNHFTGCCGQSIFRGDRLPPELNGDLILCEPVGRLIRRAKVTHVDGKTVLSNAYDHDEFIASTDPNFRPVWSATGPDGCLYIADMYRGIIQEATWVKEGSYLRPVVKRFGLDKNVGRGRIYRLTYEGMKPRAKPNMLAENPAQLVAHLSDANGWWRDTAQKLIILRGDKSVIPALKQLAISGSNPLARLHALWTLEGFDAADQELLVAKLADGDARVRAAAIRISEPLLKQKNASMLDSIARLATDADEGVVIQYVLSLLYCDVPDAARRVDQTLSTNPTKTNAAAIVKIWRDEVARKKAEEEKQRLARIADARKAAVMEQGKSIYTSVCIVCHGPDAKGTPRPENDGTTLAPPLVGSKRLLDDKGVASRIILFGLTGPIDGKTYPGDMMNISAADDDWIASVLSYCRGNFGNSASMVTPADVAKARKETDGRPEKPWTIAELEATPKPTTKKQ